MACSIPTIQRVVAFAAERCDQDVSLAALASMARLSPFHLHRMFSAGLGETPKKMTLRLRLGRAAVMLLGTRETILNVALATGFESHEVFTRAFRRRFGIGPSAYRKRGFIGGRSGEETAARHAEFTDRIDRCLGLYHVSQDGRRQVPHMSYTVQRVTLTPQPVVVARRRVNRSEISKAIMELLPPVFLFAQSQGIPVAGHPLTRYLEASHGQFTVEVGVKVALDGTNATEIPAEWLAGGGETQAVVETLPGGPAAYTLHSGPYERLQDAYAAIERWMAEEKVAPAGAPWEYYLTDPGEHPDPKDWKTEVYWPLQA